MGTSAEKRARQRANRNAGDKMTAAHESADRRRKVGIITAIVVVLIIAVVAIVSLTGSDDNESASKDKNRTTTTAPENADDSDPGSDQTASGDQTAAELPAPPEGKTLTTPTECPPVEGADERVVKFAGPPPTCIDANANYSAVFKTSEGTFTATLDAKAAPIAVNNFVVLSRFRFYDGVPFHRIVRGFVIQGGDGDGEPWGNNDLGYSFEDELPDSAEAYTDYSLAMANSGPATNGSQFFVVLPGGGAQLTPSYTRFGEVIDGRDVIDVIGALGNAAQEPTKAVVIESVTIEET